LHNYLAPETFVPSSTYQNWERKTPTKACWAWKVLGDSRWTARGQQTDSRDLEVRAKQVSPVHPHYPSESLVRVLGELSPCSQVKKAVFSTVSLLSRRSGVRIPPGTWRNTLQNGECFYVSGRVRTPGGVRWSGTARTSRADKRSLERRESTLTGTC